MFAGALAQAFVAAWTVGVAPLLLLLLSGIESLTGRNLSGETSDTLLMVAWLPAFIVAPIVPLGGILGAITGFLGLFRSDGSRLLGAVGLILSIGLLTISAIVAVVAWGL